ncbi:MAG: hypothetical protein NTX56_02805, partial [Proteobacteria bacterium]|nr:hypothetical protein [Pseudomonadota bacterium]
FAQLANGNTAGAIGAAVGQYFGGPIGAAIGSAIMSKVGGGHNGSAYTTGYQMYGSVTPTGYTQTAMYALASDQAGHSFADAMPTGSLSNDMAFLNSLKDAIVSALTSAGKSTGLDPSKAIAALNIPINLGYSAGATDTQIIAARAKVGLDALNTALDQFAASLGMTQADMQQIISAKSAQKSLLDSLATEKEKLTAAHKALADAGLSETVQGWKDQINSLDLTKIADQQTLATMTSLKGAFDLVQTSAAGATVELRSAADILNERKGLQDQLDNLTMTSADLLDKQCNALDASNQSLFDQVQTAIAAKDATDALAASQQRIDDERLGLQDQLDQLTLSNADLLTKQSNALDASNRALFDQVTAAQAAKTAAEELTASQARIADEKRGLQDQLDNLTMTGTELLTKQRNALDASNRALFVQVTAAQAAKTAAEELAITLRTAVDDAAKGIGEAFAGVQRAVDAERKRIDASYATSAKSAQASIDSLNASVQKLATLSQALRGTLDGMQIAGSEGSARQVAQAQIAGALAIARAGGVLPDADSLRSALATVAKPSESLFKTFTEYQRDFLKTGQNIADLADITDRAQLSQQDALSLAQLQLDTLTQLHDDAVSGLDAILQKAQDQVDAANGINTSVLSIQTALVNLTSAITTLADAKTAAKIAADTPVGGTVPFTPPAGTTYNGNEIKTIQDLYTVNLGRLADAAGLAYWTAQFMADGVIDAAEKQKFAIAALPEYRAKLSAVKPFAVGTDYVAEDMIAKIHAGERIMPAADNRELMARLKNPQANNEALLAEIKALRAEVVAFRSENGAENRAMIKSTGKTALSIERVMTSPDAFLVRIATP